MKIMSIVFNKIYNMKQWQKVTALILMFVMSVAGLGFIYVQSQLGKIKRKHVDIKKLSCVDVDGYVNIALLGVDSRKMEKDNLKGTNTDCIIVASINTKNNEVKLTSVYRDTYLRINGTETYQKVNSAYAYGGAEGAMKTLNQNMDLNINSYVLFNFQMVADLVDAVDGIEVDVKKEEISELNKYTKDSAEHLKSKKYNLVKKPGKQTLRGAQAVSYGRIRKGVGDDFKRTGRMRIVIQKVTDKLKTRSIRQLIKLMDVLLPQMETNLSTNDMIGLAQRLSKFKLKNSKGWPYQVTTGNIDGVSYVFPVDLEANVVKLHKEVFGQKDYKVTDTVKEIAARIASGRSSSSNQQSVSPSSGGSGYTPPASSNQGGSSGSGSDTKQKTAPKQPTPQNPSPGGGTTGGGTKPTPGSGGTSESGGTSSGNGSGSPK
ncbi:MAG: LCP family protein [Hornefia sp.]|nr:LCP family protein [Hornefia sp.]